MKALEFLRDYNVPYQTEGPKTTEGFVNIHCPFCPGKQNYHLGISLDGRYGNCWRCGWKPISKIVAKIANVSEGQAKKIIREYGGRPRGKSSQIKRKPRVKSHRIPSSTGPLQKRHKRYLKSRGFNPNYLEKKWGLLGTSPLSTLDNVEYKNRILIPINWEYNGSIQQVSFQTRDITDRHKAKYMACPKNRELIQHKHILYGRPEKWTDTGICVEGATDVWRMGFHAFACLGIAFTWRQIRLISQHFKRVIIIFDEEPQAQIQAKKLKTELLLRNIETKNIKIKGDPAELNSREAKKLIQKIY